MTKKLEPLAGNFGLNLHWDPTEVPGEAALFEAKNVLSREGRLEGRRGFQGVGGSGSNNVPLQYSEYQGTLLRMRGADMTDSSQNLQHLNEGANPSSWTNLNTTPAMRVPYGANRHQFAVSNTVNLITDEAGAWAQDDPTVLPRRGGMPQALDARAAFVSNGGTGFGWLGRAQVAYQAIFTRTNSLGQKLRGAPLPVPLRVSNGAIENTALLTAGTTYRVGWVAAEQHPIQIGDKFQVIAAQDNGVIGEHTVTAVQTTTFDFDAGLAMADGPITYHFDFNVDLNLTEPYEDSGGEEYGVGEMQCEIYRTLQSGGDDVEPGSEFLLASTLTKGQAGWTSRTITWSDTTLDDFLGERLYTNPSRGTVARSNGRPPASADVVFFKGHAIYCNIRREPFVELELVDATQLVSGSTTITIDRPSPLSDIVLTAQAVEDAASNEFEAETDWPTAAEDVRRTAQSIVAVGNRVTGGDFRWYYVSADDDAPGKILIKAANPVDDPLGLPQLTIANGGSAFNFTTRSFEKDHKANAFAISKFEEAESVPVVSDQPIGADDDIVRAVSLNDAVLFFKERGGMYVLTGQSDGTVGASFTVVVRDQTVRIDGRDTLAVLNNAAYLYADIGFVRAKEAGVEIIGRKIERELRRLRGINSSWDSLANAGAYTSENLYCCWTPGLSTDTTPTKCWSYDVLLNEWTSAFDRPSASAFYRPTNDKFYLGIPIGDQTLVTTLQERKSYDEASDFFDEEVGVTLGAPAQATYRGSAVDVITLTWSATNPTLTVGYQLEQSGTTANVVDVVDLGSDSYQITLDGFGFSAGAANLRVPIEVVVETRPLDGRSSAVLKQFTDGMVEFEENEATEHEIGFITDYQPTADLKGVTTRSRDNTVVESQSRTLMVRVPTEFQRGRWIRLRYRHSWAGEKVSILELAAVYREISLRNTYKAPKF